MNSQKEPEIQLFVIWELGRYAESEILSDIAENFEIIQTFSITWSPYLVNNNFTRFYDTKLPINSQKETYAGVGEFKLIIVRDNSPQYEYRATSKGDILVNTRMFDAKTKYRELTGGGHKIHGTNDVTELKHDIVMLLGLSLNDFLKEYDKPEQNITDIVLSQDLPGAVGWKSFDELFYVLNECDEYIVLRNSDHISMKYYENNKGDIDLLVNDRNRCQYLLGDLSCLESETKVDSRVSIDNKVVLFEIYETGQNLFHDKYEQYLFNNKVLKNGFYCLPIKLELYTLIYHAIIFHENLSQKHHDRISSYFKRVEGFQSLEVSKSSLFELLVDFFSSVKCRFIPPNDSSVYFNYDLLKGRDILENKKRLSSVRKLVNKFVHVRSFKKYTKIIFLSFLNNELDVILGFRFRFLKKEIVFSIGNRRKYKY